MSFFHQEGQDSDLQYDDNAFLYYIASGLIVIALPTLYSILAQLFTIRHKDSSKIKGGIANTKLSNYNKNQMKKIFTLGFFLKCALLVIIGLIFIVIREQSVKNQMKLKGFDPYQILGLKKDATLNQIKKSYRQLARKYHPDKNQGDPVAQKMFILVSKSYECFTDQSKKQNCFKYGNPDGSSAYRVGIGLPNFFIKKQYMFYVLPIVLSIFLIIIPGFMLSWNNKYREVDSAGISITSYNIIFRAMNEEPSTYVFLYYFAAYKELFQEAGLSPITQEQKTKLEQLLAKIPKTKTSVYDQLNSQQLKVFWQVLKYLSNNGEFQNQKLRELFQQYLQKTRDFIELFINPEYNDSYLYNNPQWHVHFCGANFFFCFLQFEKDYYNRTLGQDPNLLKWIYQYNISNESTKAIIQKIYSKQLPAVLMQIVTNAPLLQKLVNCVQEKDRAIFRQQLTSAPIYKVQAKLKVADKEVKGLTHVDYAEIIYRIKRQNKNSGYKCHKNYPYPKRQKVFIIGREEEQIHFVDHVDFNHKADEYIGKVQYRTNRVGKHTILIYVMNQTVRNLDSAVQLSFQVIEQPAQILQKPVKIHKQDMNIQKSHKTYFQEMLDLQLDPQENALSDSDEEEGKQDQQKEILRHAPGGKCCDQEH